MPLTSENRVGSFESKSNISTIHFDLYSLQPPWENTTRGYDVASGVGDYARQNPWSAFDPLGLEKTKAGVTVTRKKHHKSPVSTWDSNGLSHDIQARLNDEKYRIGKDGIPHGSAAHDQYTKRVDAITKTYIKEKGIDPSGLSGKAARDYADGLVEAVDSAGDAYVNGFNSRVAAGATQAELKVWGREYKAKVVTGRTKDVWFRAKGQFLVKGGKTVSSAKAAFGSIGRKLPGFLKGVAVTTAISEFSSDLEAGEPVSEAARTQMYRFSSIHGNTPEERTQMGFNRVEKFHNLLMNGRWETDAERDARENR